MEEKNKEKTYWPHMIVGFLFLGLSLGYWTIKSASSMPVERENKYMMAYQKADEDFNEIMQKEKAFNALYDIAIQNVEIIKVDPNVNSKVKQADPIKLNQGKNSFAYKITTKDGQLVEDAKVTFLLTRPHTDRDDMEIEDIIYKDGLYTISDIDIEKIGRYTLVIKAEVGDAIGYNERPAFLEKEVSSKQ
ncbi:MAG: FixH family protein [Campylobacterales bacterium]|nr:FixH family protein [Campylobacterales bacterium]